MGRVTTVLAALILSGCSTTGGNLSHPATVVRNCGYTDGGGYDISIDMGDRDISIHADGPPNGGEWRSGSELRILVCDRRLDQCTRPSSGSLRVFRQTRNKFNGNISFELTHQSESIDFLGVVKNPEELLICG